MPAVVRVKRRIDEEPLSAFVLNGKRRRLDEENASAIGNKEELSTLLKFAGTIKEQDDTATTQFARLSKEEAKELVLQKSRKPNNSTEKTRQEIRQHQHEQRFHVVNCLRTTLDEDNINAKSKEITIVDIEKHATNDKTVEIPKSRNENINLSEASTSAAAAGTETVFSMPADSDTGYVYDLYLPDNEQQAEYVDLMDDNYLSVRAFDNLVYEDSYNNDDEDEYDSEDSNQENYFGNEYPDEEDDAASNSDREENMSEDEDDGTKHLRRELKKFVFEDDDEESDNDSSSDDDGFHNSYRDPYVHSIDREEEGFCYDVDSCDVNRYDLAYSRIFKKRNFQMGSDIEDSDEYHDNTPKSGTDEEDDNYHSANESEG